MKLRGFGHNKRAYCRIMCGAGVLEVTQTKGPLRANTQLCFCLPALTLCYLVLRARRPRWERGRCAGWIFIWDQHLRLCTLHYACDWCAVLAALFRTESVVINSCRYSAVFWSQVPTLFAYLTQHASKGDRGAKHSESQQRWHCRETFRGAIGAARTWNKAKIAGLSPPWALHCVGYNEGIECFMKSISLQINLV